MPSPAEIAHRHILLANYEAAARDVFEADATYRASLSSAWWARCCDAMDRADAAWKAWRAAVNCPECGSVTKTIRAEAYSGYGMTHTVVIRECMECSWDDAPEGECYL